MVLVRPRGSRLDIYGQRCVDVDLRGGCCEVPGDRRRRGPRSFERPHARLERHGARRVERQRHQWAHRNCAPLHTPAAHLAAMASAASSSAVAERKARACWLAVTDVDARTVSASTDGLNTSSTPDHHRIVRQSVAHPRSRARPDHRQPARHTVFPATNVGISARRLV
jgi:hypothetical protein